MKTIQLKILSTDDPQEKIDYKEVVEMIAKSPNTDTNGRPVGLSIDEVRKGVRLLKAVEAAKEELSLEDADYNYLLTKAKSFKWAKSSENIVQFMDDLQDAKEVK